MSNYYEAWQNNRINFILKYYNKEFFKDKTILELGPCNGYIGNYFHNLGANVTLLEGRKENIDNIKNIYPYLTVIHENFDIIDWPFGKFDIIINFGVFYHLEKFHKQHLINCINNSKILFFESVIYDSFQDELYFREEQGFDQSLTGIGGTPSTSFVENILSSQNCNYIKFTDSDLNGERHKYDWIDLDSKILDQFNRRMWFIENK
jgi:hypothetical protein